MVVNALPCMAASVQFSSVAQSCLTLWPQGLQHTGLPCPSPTPGLSQTHIHRWCHRCIGDAILLSHPLSSPSPSTFNLFQHQGLFKWVSSSHKVVKVLEFQLQPQSFQWIFRTDLLQDGLVGSPCCPRDSQESSPTPQFRSINSPALRFPYSPILTFIHDHWKNQSFDQMDLCWLLHYWANFLLRAKWNWSYVSAVNYIVVFWK